MPQPRRLFDHRPDSGWMVEGELDEHTVLDVWGHPPITVRTPRIVRRFNSPQHTLESTARSRGPWGVQFIAFMCNRIPFAKLRAPNAAESDHAELRACVVYAIENGAAGLLRVDHDGQPQGELARPDRIADAIDLDALSSDYEAWLTAAGINSDLGSTALDVRAELAAAIGELRTSRYCDYLDCIDPYRDSAGFIRVLIIDGIVLGEDPAVTCAFILAGLTGDPRLWQIPG